MAKDYHEIRDPIHGFIIFNDLEKEIINSPEFQRLKYIRQLGMGYLVYPGSHHTRFEHSLGVMELATRVFDTLIAKGGMELKSIFGWNKEADVERTRQILRLSALLHDLGHPPFSHMAEALFPNGYDHERYTEEIIREASTRRIIEQEYYRKGIRLNDIIPVIKSKQRKIELNATMNFLNEIITGDLGVDRIDYLIRDSHHTGVMYGKFDYERLLNTLIVIKDPATKNPVLAIERGGLHAAEGLILARYFMFLQVYYHDIRRIYDIHLQDFLKEFLVGSRFPNNLHDYLELNDSTILAKLHEASRDASESGHLPAELILARNHFRCVHEVTAADRERDHELFDKLEREIERRFGKENCRFDEPSKATNQFSESEFLVIEGGKISNILEESDLIQVLKPIYRGRIYVKNEKTLKGGTKEFCEDFMRKISEKIRKKEVKNGEI